MTDHQHPLKLATLMLIGAALIPLTACPPPMGGGPGGGGGGGPRGQLEQRLSADQPAGTAIALARP